jgi:hypothetical protein
MLSHCSDEGGILILNALERDKLYLTNGIY